MPEYIDRVRLERLPNADSYLHRLPVVRNLWEKGGLTFESNVVVFVGENGTGKSTLLEAMAVAMGFNAEGGTRNYLFSTSATHSDLWKSVVLTRTAYRPRDGYFLRAESLYNAASYIDRLAQDDPGFIEDYGGKSLHEQSHGESFLALVQNRFGGGGLYLLDEPEAALSPMRQLTLMAQMHLLLQSRSQLFIATHSPILLAFPGAQVIELTAHGMETVDYRQTEHYTFTKSFLDSPQRMLHSLLEEKDGGQE